MDSTSSIDEALSSTKTLPPYSCSTVDSQIRDAERAADDAGKAARETEDESATSALENTASALEDCARALDAERVHAALLRDGAEERESVARLAIRQCEARDEKIETLEAEIGEREAIIELQRHQLGVSQEVIDHLGEQIKKSWWHRLGDEAQRLRWQHRAKATAKRNRHLREDKQDAEFQIGNLFDALLTAYETLEELEWETIGGGLRRCPHCHIEWVLSWGKTAPEHRNGCHIGRASQEARRALQIQAQGYGFPSKRG